MLKVAPKQDCSGWDDLSNGEYKGVYAKVNVMLRCKAITIMKTCCACSSNYVGMSGIKSLSAYLSEPDSAFIHWF